MLLTSIVPVLTQSGFYWYVLQPSWLLCPSGLPGLGTKVQISWTGRVTAGSPTTFTCSSNCFPNCIYTWSFKASTVNGSTLTWTPDGLDDTVKLVCTVFNPQTGVYTSTDTIVEITSEYIKLNVTLNSGNNKGTFYSVLLKCLPWWQEQGVYELHIIRTHYMDKTTLLPTDYTYPVMRPWARSFSADANA